MNDVYDDQGRNHRGKDIEESAEERTISSRERARSQLNSDIEKFLAQGGTINQIDPDVTADPPRKPQPKYGSRPI